MAKSKVCPHCDKRGLMQEVYGKKWYTHVQIAGFSDKGPVMFWDMHPKQKIIVEDTPPASA